MRLLPFLLLLLLAAVGVSLALTVMRSGSVGHPSATSATHSAVADTSTVAGEADSKWPPVLGGKPQGHVYAGAAGEPSDVNPFTTYDPLGRRLVLAYTHDTLLDHDPKSGELRPALCENYEISADGTTCTFTIREGLKFSDGSAVTMEDVLFGWELAQAGHLAMGYIGQGFERIRSVDSLDHRRFRAHFTDQHFAAVEAVGLNWMVAKKQFFIDCVQRGLPAGEPMPAIDSALFATLLDQVDEQCGPGTGPYQLLNDPSGVSNWDRRQELLLTRNQSSWRREVMPGTWNFAGMRTLFRDQAGARNALLRGEVDWYSGPQLDQLLASNAKLADGYQKLVYDYPELGCYRIIWNCKQAPFDDVRVRSAMGMLVNRSEVAEVFGGSAMAATAHGKLGSRAYPSVEPLPFDPVAARRLLREAGFDAGADKPLRMTLLTYQGHEPTRRVVELFADAAKQAGVELEVHARESSGFVAEKAAGEWHGILALQYFGPWGDPYRFLHSKGLQNIGSWSHPDADRLSLAARQELDAARRSDMWRELHELAHREQPATLIVHPLASMLFNKNIEDCQPGPRGLKPDWGWVEPERQRR